MDGSSGRRAQVYFSARDAQNRAQIGRASLNLDDSASEPEFEPEPLVRIGPPGAFDDSGVTGGCLVRVPARSDPPPALRATSPLQGEGDYFYLYFSGWSLGVQVPFLFYIGCALSTDGGSHFEKVSAAPVLGRNRFDPFLTASPSVLVEGGIWRMWYVSGTGWSAGPEVEPSYNIRYAESNDGIEWRPTGRVCIDYSYAGEHAIARPHVMKDGSTYRMWYSHRGDSYRIGYAESTDGLQWVRKDDEAGITVSPEGWDSEMVAYPWVGDIGGRRRMLYNGNSYGRTGIGEALLEQT